VALIDVGEVTTWLIGALSVNHEVGDGEAPPAAGWSDGTPNKGTFVAYVVIKQQGPITSTLTDTPLCDMNAIRYEIPYQMVSYEITRAESDALAADARDSLKSLTGMVECGDLTVNADQVRIRTVEGASRDDSTFPKFWMSVTNFTVNVARS
jgi:hypothetical protein